jgi:hypothetical protein
MSEAQRAASRDNNGGEVIQLAFLEYKLVTIISRHASATGVAG